MRELRVEPEVLGRQGAAVASADVRRIHVPTITREYDAPSIDGAAAEFLSDWADFLYELERAAEIVGERLAASQTGYADTDRMIEGLVQETLARWDVVSP